MPEKQPSFRDELKARLTSRKFLLALMGTLGTVYAAYNRTVAPEKALYAVAVFITSYVIGEAYVDGKRAESVPPAQQQALIEQHAQNMATAILNQSIVSGPVDPEYLGFAPSVAVPRGVSDTIPAEYYDSDGDGLPDGLEDAPAQLKQYKPQNTDSTKQI